MESLIYDEKYNNFINQINEYMVSTDGIFKKIYDDNYNLINIQTDTKLEEFINTLNKNYKNEIFKNFEKKADFKVEIINVKSSHYLSESDQILVDSHGNTGFKLNIIFKDYTICEESLCLDDFPYTKKEDIIPYIKKRFNTIKENYTYLSLYLYTNIYKEPITETIISDKISDISKYKFDIQSVPIIPQVAGKKNQ